MHSTMMTLQLIPLQGISLRTPTPYYSANLSMPSYNNFAYSSQWQGWQLMSGGAAANFSLTLPQPQAIQLSFVMCSMAKGGGTNNPITLTVNGYQLFTQFDPHREVFVTFTFYIPNHWLVAGNNALKLSLDGNASTKATFQSIDVAGIDPQVNQATNISFETPNPVATSILSIADQQGTVFDSRFNAWQLKVPGKYVTYNLYLDQPRLVALSMNFCSMAVGGGTNNPFNITVNGKTLVANYDPHVQHFHDEQWLVPANWVIAGNNRITVTLSGAAKTLLDYKRFGAAAQVLPPRTGSVTLTHNSGRIEANWPTMSGVTSYQIELYTANDLTNPVFTSKGFLGSGIVFPQTAQPGRYSVRVQPWMDNVAGTWTDFSTVTLFRTILFLSSSGQTNPAAARLALEGLGTVVYGNADNLHFEALASDSQIAAARPLTSFLGVYAGALTTAQIATLPANQRSIAEAWNYYYSPEYQRVLADTTNANRSWGDPAISSPPVSNDVPADMVRAILGGASVANDGTPPEDETIAHMPHIERDHLKSRLKDHLSNPAATDALAHSFTALPEHLREQLFEPQFREQLLALADANPKVAMRGTYAVGIIIVQSSKDVSGVPAGWKTARAVAAGEKAFPINSGSNDPQPGDQMRIDAFSFKVTAWEPTSMTLRVDTAAPATASGAAITTVAAPRKGPRFSDAERAVVVQKAQDAFQTIQNKAPEFRPFNWVAAKAVNAGATTLPITGGQTFPRPGDTFTLPGKTLSFSVSAFDALTSTITTSAVLPAIAVDTALTFPDALNFRTILQPHDVEINVGVDDYNPNDPATDGAAYWVLPAVAKVQIAGRSFPGTWDGLESLRQAVQANTGASGAGLIFLSTFPSDWFAFAISARGMIVMTRFLKTFNKSYDATVSGQLDARNQAAVRTWINTGLAGNNHEIPTGAPLAITVDLVGHRWHITTSIQYDFTGERMLKTFIIAAIGSPAPSTLAVSYNEGYSYPRWDDVIVHETFHLFGAPDEYTGVGTPCTSCAGAYGVYNIPNGNCASCAKPLQECVMDRSDTALCDYSQATIGWSDVLVEVTTDPSSLNNNDPMWVKLGDGLMFRLSDQVIDDRQPGSRDAYALGYTRLQRADIAMIAVGNENAAEVTTAWKVKRIRVWVQGALIYDKDNLGATVDKARSWLLAPGFEGNISGYLVTITTGDRWFAGTIDDVYIFLGGKRAILNEFVQLDDAPYGGYTGFPTGSVKTTAISPTRVDLANNRTVSLQKAYAMLIVEPLYGGDEWFPAHIKIVAQRQNGGDVVVLDTDINTWIGLGKDVWSKQIQNVP